VHIKQNKTKQNKTTDEWYTLGLKKKQPWHGDECKITFQHPVMTNVVWGALHPQNKCLPSH
jgi:hypothetical protein